MEQSRAFKNIKQRLYAGIAWNSIETIIYQLLLNTHLIVLYMRSDSSIFGLFGLVLAGVYMMVPFINLGLDQALLAHTHELTISRHALKQLFIKQLFTQTVIWLFVACIIGAFYVTHVLPVAIIHLPLQALLLAVFIMLLETQRRSCRHLLQLFFDNRFTALTEISAILIYITLFWYLALNFGFSIFVLLIPLALQSLWSLCILGLRIYNNYCSLQDTPCDTTTKQLWHERFALSGTIISRIAFATNTFMYVIGALFGVTPVAVLKLANTLSTLMTIIIEHTVGIPIITFIAHAKAEKQIVTHDAYRLAFTWLSSICLSAFFFVLINYKKIALVCTGSTEWWHIIIVYILLILIENMVTVTEKIGYIARIMPAILRHNIQASILWIIALIAAAYNFVSLLSLLLIALVIRIFTLFMHGRSIAFSSLGFHLFSPNILLIITCVVVFTLALYTVPHFITSILCR